MIVADPRDVPLFVMNVNIGQGVKKTIKFWKHNDSASVAEKFCDRWNMDPSAIDFL